VWAGHVTINILPDDVLLHIVDFDRIAYLEDIDPWLRHSWRWHRLVHVCQRWRSVVFASPNFLGLRLVYGPRTRLELRGIWPPLPITIKDEFDRPMPEDYDFDAAVVHRNRVCEINLVYLTSLQLQRLASAMHGQFPALISLILQFPSFRRPAPVLPDGFLGGYAPRLQYLTLHSIPFPALPKLLLSATDLVRLILWDIPYSGYISPETFVTCLVLLADLKYLAIGFEYSSEVPDRESQHPLPTRAVLPALARFEFHGESEYSEDIVTWIDAPSLEYIFITLFHDDHIFDTSQLGQFMRRTTRFKALNEAYVEFDNHNVQVKSLPPAPTGTLEEMSGLIILCKGYHLQPAFLVHVFTSLFPSIYVVEHLYIYGIRNLLSQWYDTIEIMPWFEIFLPFRAVKNLYACETVAQLIAPSLQQLVGERVTDVLPALESLFLDLRPSDIAQEDIRQFVAARQLLGRPLSVSHWVGIGI
jgi:hypothetical protein